MTIAQVDGTLIMGTNHNYKPWWFLKQHLCYGNGGSGFGWHVKQSYGGSSTYFGSGDYITDFSGRWNGASNGSGPGSWFILRSNSPIGGSYREFLIRRQNTAGSYSGWSVNIGSAICGVWYSPTGSFSSGSSTLDPNLRPTASDEKQLLGENVNPYTSFYTNKLAAWNASAGGTNCYTWIGASSSPTLSWFIALTSNISPYTCYGIIAFDHLNTGISLDPDPVAIWICNSGFSESNITSSYAIIGHDYGLWNTRGTFHTLQPLRYTSDDNTSLKNINVTETGYNVPLSLPVALKYSSRFKGFSDLFKWCPTNYDMINMDTINSNYQLKIDNMFISWNGSSPNIP
jgi:hypothetical protein